MFILITTAPKELGGIAEIFGSLESRWPRTSTLLKYLIPKTPHIVDGLSSLHYNADSCGRLAEALQYCRDVGVEDNLYRGLKWFINPDETWRAFDDALLLLSRYPIKEPEIFPYQARADHEHFVRKAILKAEIHPPGWKPVTIHLTHNQEGKSRHARLARERQMSTLRRLRKQSNYPVVVMGDLNDERERWLAEQLGLVDSYRSIFPDVHQDPGHTYDADTPYARQQGITAAQNSKLRIDYIFTDYSLQVRRSQIRRDEFRHPQKEYDLSDHFPVETEVTLAA